MYKCTLRKITEGRSESFFGGEPEVRQRLREECPESEQYHRLDDIVRAINEFGQSEVEVDPWQAPLEQNLLPPGYQTAEEIDPKESE